MRFLPGANDHTPSVHQREVVKQYTSESETTTHGWPNIGYIHRQVHLLLPVVNSTIIAFEVYS